MNNFLFIPALILCSFLLQAQDENVNPEWKSSGDWEFGALVGFTSNSISKNTDIFIPESQSGNSFMIGVLANKYLDKNWSIGARANYESRDFGFSGSANYLSTSISANWHFGKNRRWNLQLGPNYSYKLDGIIGLESSIGSNFGIGVIIPISGLKFFIELNEVDDFNAGERNVFDIDGNVIDIEKSSIRRSSLSFGLRF